MLQKGKKVSFGKKGKTDGYGSWAGILVTDDESAGGGKP